MRIRDRVTRSVSGSNVLRGRGKTEAVSDTERSAAATDSVSISGRGVEIRRARSLALEAPEIRQALVDEIVDQLERGEYHVSGSDVAPKMIQEHMVVLELGAS